MQPPPSPYAVKPSENPKHTLDAGAAEAQAQVTPRSKGKRLSPTPNASSDTRSSSKSKDSSKPKTAKKGGIYSLFTPKTRKHNMLQDDDSDNDGEEEDAFTFGDIAKPKPPSDDPFTEFEDEMGLDFDDDASGAGRDRKKSRRQVANKGDRLGDPSPRAPTGKGADISPVLAAASSTLKRLKKGKGGSGKSPKGSSGKTPKAASSKTPKAGSSRTPKGESDGQALLSSNPFDDY